MRFVRVGICVLLGFAVLAFGAVEEWAQAVLEAGAGVLLVFWSIRRYRRGYERLMIPTELLPLGAFAVLVMMQWVFHLTASRYATRVNFQLLLTYMIVIFLISQVYTQTSHWRGFLWFLMAMGFFISIFAILQYLTFNGKLYWFRVIHSGVTAFGPYANRNHFAGFAELLIPVALVPLVLGKVRRERLFLVGLFALVPIVTLVLSASRGGFVSFVAEISILFLLMLMRRIRSKHMIVGGAVLLGAMMAVSWIGVQQVLQRFSETESLEVTFGKRAAMRQDAWRLFRNHPVLGTGLGTFEQVFPPYDSDYDGKIVNHAHNDYLELLAETGALGGLCCLGFLGVVFLDSLKGMAAFGSSFGSVLNLSGLVGCCGILVHSLVDFNLHIPANALLFFVSAHLATVRLQAPSASVAEGGSRHHRTRKQ